MKIANRFPTIIRSWVSTTWTIRKTMVRPCPHSRTASRRSYFFPLNNRNRAMNGNIFPGFKDEGEVIASWGEAKLVKFLDGRLELKGGSKEHHREAREWISLFGHEAVVREI